jgi:hypothetical protein
MKFAEFLLTTGWGRFALVVLFFALIWVEQLIWA